MSDIITIPTERPDVTLRQLKLNDAPAYFELVNSSRDHLAEFERETADKYPTLESVENSLITPENERKLRFGITVIDTLVGTINLTPGYRETAATVGYWVGERFTRRGYATTALRALVEHYEETYRTMYAHVEPENVTSMRVLKRANFQCQGNVEYKGKYYTSFVRETPSS